MKRVIAHTHPNGTPFASAGDQSALLNMPVGKVGQQHSYVVAVTADGGKVVRFERAMTPAEYAAKQREIDAILEAQWGNGP